jgi:NADPH:quinone reductase-like Zn-dependent oxidoreductase
MVTKAMLCFPLLKSVTLEQGAMMLVNPMTAWALLDMARRGGHRAVAHTAAASALGKMLLRLGQRFNYPVVHIVRRQSQVDLLRGMGAAHVLNSSDADFDSQLRETFHRLDVTLAFDAVAGEMTGRLLAALPRGGHIIVYGGLSQSACVLHPGQLIFEKKGVSGFWLSDWVPRVGLAKLLRTAYSVQRRLSTDLQTSIHARVPLEDAMAGVKTYMNEMTKGKVLVML